MISPDTLIPGAGDPQNLNRYMYARGNPVRYKDPTGHWIETALDIAFIGYDLWDISQNGLNWENGLSLAADVAGAVLPVVTGGGLAVRAAMHADDAAKVLTHVDDAAKVVNAADGLADVGQAVNRAVDAVNNVCSFSGETLVSSPEGLRPIESFEPGDQVMAYHEETGEIGTFAVTAVWVHTDKVVEYLSVDGEIIEVTPEHPFFTMEAGWVNAGSLWLGAHVVRADGVPGRVTQISFTAMPQTMYNLTVAEAHTFFVSDKQILVHNTCGDKLYTAYRAVEDGITTYVGITTDFVRRQGEHAQIGRIIEPITDGLSRVDARGVEQVLINQFGLPRNGGQLDNLINSISPSRNPQFYQDALAAGRKVLNEAAPLWEKWK